MLACFNACGSSDIAVYTNQPSITLKRLSDLNIAMPPGQFSWSVFSDGTGKTVDELLAPTQEQRLYQTLSASPPATLINGTLLPFPPNP